MPVTRERRPIGDFERDAKKYHLLLLALQGATSEIRTLEREGGLGIDQVLERMLPDLAKALNAAQAFVAVLHEEQGNSKWFDLTAAYPKKELRGCHLPCSGVLQQIVSDEHPRVIDSFEQPSAPIPGLELLGATSAVVVVLRTAGRVRVVGICNKADPDLGLFLAADRMALDYLVELVAIGARVGERRSQELKQIQKTSAAISSELDLNELLLAIVNGAADIFGAPAVSLMLWDEAKENLVIEASHGLSDEYFKQQCVPKDKVLSAIPLAGEPRPIVTPDLRATPFGRRDLIECELLCSVLTAPLLASHKMIGILNVYSKGKPRQFSPDEVELAEIVANQAAIAIYNARLYSEALQRQRHFETVARITPIIGATLDPDEVVRAILTETLRVIGRARQGCMLHYDSETGGLIFSPASFEFFHIDVPQEQGRTRVRADEKSIAGRVARTGRPANVPDIRAHSDYLQLVSSTRSELCVPIKVQDDLLGVLELESDQANAFTNDDERLLRALADQVAVALKKAQEHSQLLKTQHELAANVAIDWMGLLGSNLAHTVNQRTWEIEGKVYLLRQSLNPLKTNIERWLDEIEEATRQLKALPIAGKSSARPGPGEGTASIDKVLAECVPRWCEKYYPDVELHLELNCGAETLVPVEQGWLEIPLEKLVNNALKAMSWKGQLTVRSERYGGSVEVQVQDTGKGIPEEIVKEYLLQRPVPRTTSREGSGLGLLIARKVLEAYGGDLKLLHTVPGKGTTFVFHLPVAQPASGGG
jgi:GAF domain-containing protein